MTTPATAADLEAAAAIVEVRAQTANAPTCAPSLTGYAHSPKPSPRRTDDAPNARL